MVRSGARGFATVALVLVVAAGCGSDDDDGPAPPPGGPTTVVTVGGTAAPEAATLRGALEALGVQLASAPDAVHELDAPGVVACGVQATDNRTPRQYMEQPSPVRRCFVDAHLARTPAWFVRGMATTEGDPIVEVWIARADGSIEIHTDATRDSFGSGEWDAQTCGRLTTKLPNPALAPDYFTCSAGGGGHTAPVDVTAPDWFTERAELPLCGYDVGIEDDDQPRRACFRSAYDAGSPAEYAYISYGDEGESSARWFRVLGPGDYEVFERQVASAAAGTFDGWVKHACTEIVFRDDPGFAVEGLPTLDACTAVR